MSGLDERLEQHEHPQYRVRGERPNPHTDNIVFSVRKMWKCKFFTAKFSFTLKKSLVKISSSHVTLFPYQIRTCCCYLFLLNLLIQLTPQMHVQITLWCITQGCGLFKWSFQIITQLLLIPFKSQCLLSQFHPKPNDTYDKSRLCLLHIMFLLLLRKKKETFHILWMAPVHIMNSSSRI